MVAFTMVDGRRYSESVKINDGLVQLRSLTRELKQSHSAVSMALLSLTTPLPSTSATSPSLFPFSSISYSSPKSSLSILPCRPFICSSLSFVPSLHHLPATLVLPTRRLQKHIVRMAPEEEKMTRRSPLDFPIEWERPKPGRRPDIFPQFSPMKTPLPPPLPADPPEEDEEEEEEKKEEEEEEEHPEKEENDEPGLQ